MVKSFVIVLLLIALTLKPSVLENITQECGTSPAVCPIRKGGSCGYRPYDGSCSNTKNPRCGSNRSLYARLVASTTEGRHNFPVTSTGAQFPNARVISASLFPLKETLDSAITLDVMQYGQLITHDMSMTQTESSPLACCTDEMHFFTTPPSDLECASINVTKDPFYEKYDATCVSMFRTQTNKRDNCSLWTKHDEPLSLVSATLDLHIIYGELNPDPDSDRNVLRSYHDGLLKTEIRNNQEWPTDVPTDVVDRFCYSVIKPKLCFFGGDPRINQNSHLIVLEVLYLRQHNSIARKLAVINPQWNDQRLFEEARRINIAIHQHISYYELLEHYTGKKFLYDHKILFKTKGFVNDYKDDICPTTLNEFAHAAFRHFHSMIVNNLKLYSNDRNEVGNISMADWFNDPVIVEENFDALAIGLHTQPSGASDINFVFEINNKMFPKYKECGLDLRAIDIQRGRDHGLPSYNTMREYCGFKKAKRFEDFADHITITKIRKLKKIYDHVDDVELVVGGSYETSAPGARTGPVFLCIMGVQFYRTRAGDPYWYEREECGFTLEQLKEIRKATIALVLCNNGMNITSMQRRAFKTVSYCNPIVPCTDIEQIDLNKWKEYST